MTITEDTRPALGLPQIQSLAAADMAAATADHLEEAAALMQAVEDSIGDDLGRVGEGL